MPDSYARPHERVAEATKVKAKKSKVVNEADSRDWSWKNAGKAVGNLSQIPGNAVAAVKSAKNAVSTAASDFSKGYDSSQQPTGQSTKPDEEEYRIVREKGDVDEAFKKKSRPFKQVSKLGREKGNKIAADMWAKKIKAVREAGEESTLDATRDYTDVEGNRDAAPVAKPAKRPVDPRDYTDVEGNQPVAKEAYDHDKLDHDDIEYILNRSKEDEDKSEYEYGEEDPMDELSVKTYKNVMPRAYNAKHFPKMADADRRYEKHNKAEKWADRQISKHGPQHLRENVELDAIKMLSGLK
jgi:hypothetical protein